MSLSIWQTSPHTFFGLNSQCPVVPFSICPTGNHHTNKLINDDIETALARMETEFYRESKTFDVKDRCIILKAHLYRRA